MRKLIIIIIIRRWHDVTGSFSFMAIFVQTTQIFAVVWVFVLLSDIFYSMYFLGFRKKDPKKYCGV